MRCSLCNKEYPSNYYFKTDTVCLDCYNRMNEGERREATSHNLMKHPLTSTTFTIEGYKIVQQLGVVRYDTTELMDGVTEVLCYGTAVIVEKI